MRRLAAFAGLLLLIACAPARAAPAPFSDWAAVVVAGDDKGAHSGAPTAAFDNARRDIAAALIARGFAPNHVAQFSVEAFAHPETTKSDIDSIWNTLAGIAKHASGGCLIYFTSHGDSRGIVVGDTLVPPAILSFMVGRTCPNRPVVAIVSACFSGVFVHSLEGPEHLVLTAARRDRSSFGCSESDRYPFFDQCILESFPAAADFTALGPLARTCVGRRETAENARPPSEPQISVGKKFRAEEPDFAQASPTPAERTLH